MDKIDELKKHKKDFNQELEDNVNTYNELKKQQSRAAKLLLTAERNFVQNNAKYDSLTKLEKEHECAIADMEDEIKRRELAIAEISAAKHGIDISSKQKEEAQAGLATSESKCKAAKRNVDDASNMLQQAVQAHKERSEAWLGWTGKEVFESIGLPFSPITYYVLKALAKSEIKVLHKALKTRGFLPAAEFSLHTKNKDVLLKEVCDAVGVPVPIEKVQPRGKDLVAASALKLNTKKVAWSDFLASCEEPDQYNVDEPSSDDDEAEDVEEV